MAATVEIRSYHGTTPDAGTNVAASSLRFKDADNSAVNSLDPLNIPGTGTIFSFLKQLRFYASVAPSNIIDTLQVFTDGTNGMGTGVAMELKTEAGYTNPVALGAADMGGGTDAFTFDSGSPLAITGSTSTTGVFGNYLKAQLNVTTTASVGTTPAENLSFKYDES